MPQKQPKITIMQFIDMSNSLHQSATQRMTPFKHPKNSSCCGYVKAWEKLDPAQRNKTFLHYELGILSTVTRGIAQNASPSSRKH
jgi:hypothetical protein